VWAVRGHREIAVFDISASSPSSLPTLHYGSSPSSSSLFKGDLLSLNWSFDGELIITTAGDKFLRLMDLRDSGISFNNE
jgi:WD40 repeat protein